MAVAKTQHRIKLEARWHLYWRLLADLGDIREALRRAQIPYGVRINWRKKHPDFIPGEQAALEEFDRRSRVVENPVPGFLEFQRLHCAYFSRAKQKFVRAENTWFMKDAVSQLDAHDALAIIMPPGHLKTTTFSIEYVAWNIFRDRNVRILVVQKNQTEASKIVGEVASRLSNHDYYHNLAERLTEQKDEPITCPLCVYGDDFKPEVRKEAGGRWAATGFRVSGITSGEKDLTFEAKGVGSQIQGIRGDLIILDDVQDPEQAVRSLQDSEDKMGWFQRVIFGRINPAQRQKLVVLANYFGDTDFAHLVAELFEASEVPVVKYPALLLTSPSTGERYKEPKLLCPEFWTKEALDVQRKRVGEEVWHYTYMQEEGTFDQRTFKRERLLEARSEQHYLGVVPDEVNHVFVGCDPATSNSGYCSIVKWGLDTRTKQRYLIDVFNEKGLLTFQNVEKAILDMCADGTVRTVVIEGNAQQKAQSRSMELQKELRNLGVRQLEIYQTVSGTGARAEQSNFDITTIGGLFDVGLVTLPYAGTALERSKVDSYIDQLCRWKTDEDGHSIKHLTRDMVMATLFAESEAFDMARRPDREVKPPQRYLPSGRGSLNPRFTWKDAYPEHRSVSEELRRNNDRLRVP